MPDIEFTPAHPYSLAQSAAGSDPSRRWRDGVLELVFHVDETPVGALAWQRPDGTVVVRTTLPPGNRTLTHLRFVLAIDDDITPFLDLVRDDPLLGSLVSARRGMRPVRTSTVAHALLQAVAGQLITAREARQIEHRIVALTSRRHGELWLPPTSEALRALSSAQLVRAGLAPRRAGALARIVRTFDVERLRGVSTAQAVARIQREPTLGPWSAGVIALHGLGRYEHGLVGDLSLIRLCSNLLGRTATAKDTADLLAQYGPWAGLAGLHLMRHPFARQRTLGSDLAA
jgi:3-methyladenine DNA glycosylase/8-oxoguanine DNA glycosylase